MTVRGGVELGVKIGCPPPLPSSPSSCHARVLQFGGSVTILMSHRHIGKKKKCARPRRVRHLFFFAEGSSASRVRAFFLLCDVSASSQMPFRYPDDT